jgi:hypothetical protein
MRLSATIVAFHICTALVASMTFLDFPFRLHKSQLLLVKKYDKR